MTIEYIPVTELIPYANNPRRNDDAVDAVAESIRAFGFRNPVIVDSNGEIVAGHTRVKAARKLGLKEVPVILADDLTDEQIRAFRLADNKAQELSSWDFSLLMDELTAIEDYDMSLFGFSMPGEGEETTGRRKTEGARKSNLDDGYEVDLDSFSEETFTCTCPECGFKFNE